MKKSFESLALALRAAAANSVMVQAMASWMEDFETSDVEMSQAARNYLKKISLAATFTADSSLVAVQFTA